MGWLKIGPLPGSSEDVNQTSGAIAGSELVMQRSGYECRCPRTSHCSLRTVKLTALPIPVAVRSKAWVCGHPLAGIVGSNPAGGIDVCLL